MTLRPLFASAAAGAVVAGGAVALLAGGAGDPAQAKPREQRVTAASRAFSVVLPKGWHVEADGPGATVLERDDDRGLAVVRPRGALKPDLARLGRHLEKRLLRELPGARPAGTRTFETAAGPGLLTTLVRGDKVHGLAVLPAGDRSFSIDLLASGGSDAAARDLARVVRSFRPQQR